MDRMKLEEWDGKDENCEDGTRKMSVRRMGWAEWDGKDIGRVEWEECDGRTQL